MADTCNSVWSYVGRYRWNVCREHKSVRSYPHIRPRTQRFCAKQNKNLLSALFFAGRSYRGIFGKSFAFKYLLSMPSQLASADKYCTKSTNMKYVSKYNFYKTTQTFTYIRIRELFTTGWALAVTEELAKIRGGFPLSRPYFRHLCVRACTCLPITIFLRLSFRLS